MIFYPPLRHNHRHLRLLSPNKPQRTQINPPLLSFIPPHSLSCVFLEKRQQQGNEAEAEKDEGVAAGVQPEADERGVVVEAAVEVLAVRREGEATKIEDGLAGVGVLVRRGELQVLHEDTSYTLPAKKGSVNTTGPKKKNLSIYYYLNKIS